MEANKTPKTTHRNLANSRESVSKEMKQGMRQIRGLMDFGNSDVKTSSLIAFQDSTTTGSLLKNKERLLDRTDTNPHEAVTPEKRINSRYTESRGGPGECSQSHEVLQSRLRTE